jgi:hypothetical protein
MIRDLSTGSAATGCDVVTLIEKQIDSASTGQVDIQVEPQREPRVLY